MSLTIHRNRLQRKSIDRIVNTINDKKILFLEAPTGFGKTRVALMSALELAESSGNGVIITTKNNALAKQFIIEAERIFSENGKGREKVVLDLGRRNYLNYGLALQSLSSGVLRGKLTLEELDFFVDNQLQKFSFLKRETILLSDLHELLLSKGYIVSSDELLYEISQITSDGVEQKEAGEMIEYIQQGMVVVTNHHYLLTLCRLNVINRFDCPIIADEVHSLGEAAESVFQSSFSFFRLNYLLRAVLGDTGAFEPAETEKFKKVLSFSATTQKTLAALPMHAANIDSYQKIISDCALDLKREISLHFKSKLANILNKGKFSSTESKRDAVRLIGEVGELMGTAGKELTVSLSPTKNYVTISYASTRSMFNLDRHFWSKVNGGFAGLSGTLRVSPHKGKSENEWIFFYLGLIKPDIDPAMKKFKTNLENDQTKADDFRALLEAKAQRISDVAFEVIDPIYERDSFLSWVTNDKNMRPPRFHKYDIIDGSDEKKSLQKIARNKADVESDYEMWYEGIAKFTHDNLISNGLVLTMSNKDCAIIGNLLRNKCKGRYQVLFANEEEPMDLLIKKHQECVDGGGSSVLVGNAQYYTGIDLPGKYLEQLFVAKLPFEPGNFRYGSSKGNAFSIGHDTTNKMIIAFRQGIGRVIRGEHDRGIVYVLDGRIKQGIFSKGMGFLKETSTLCKLKDIQEKGRGFLRHKEGPKEETVYASWFVDTVYGERASDAIDKSELQEIEYLASRINFYRLLSKKGALDAIVGRYRDEPKRDLRLAVLATFVYTHYHKTGVSIMQNIKAAYGSPEEFLDVFFGNKEILCEDKEILDFLAQYSENSL